MPRLPCAPPFRPARAAAGSEGTAGCRWKQGWRSVRPGRRERARVTEPSAQGPGRCLPAGPQLALAWRFSRRPPLVAFTTGLPPRQTGLPPAVQRTRCARSWESTTTRRASPTPRLTVPSAARVTAVVVLPGGGKGECMHQVVVQKTGQAQGQQQAGRRLGAGGQQKKRKTETLPAPPAHLCTLARCSLVSRGEKDSSACGSAVRPSLQVPRGPTVRRWRMRQPQ